MRAQAGRGGGARLSSPARPHVTSFGPAQAAVIGKQGARAPEARPPQRCPAHRLTGMQVWPASWNKMRAPKGSAPPKLVAVTPDLAAARRPKFLSSGPTPLPQATFHPQSPTSSFQSPEAPHVPGGLASRTHCSAQRLSSRLFLRTAQCEPDDLQTPRAPLTASSFPAQHPLRLAAHPSSASPQLRARTLP